MAAKNTSSSTWDAALIVKYGNTARKQFALSTGSTVLGRARGCDVELESPDVSSVHCVITRHSNGIVIRDLNSRSGTKLNGDRIREEVPLRSTDVLQIGPFSFDVVVPDAMAPQPALEHQMAEARQQIDKLERSREKMAEMALALRRRLSVERAARRAVPAAARPEVDEAIRRLAEEQVEVERRAAELSDAERAAAVHRTELVRQHDLLRDQVETHEEELAKFEASQRTFEHERDDALRELGDMQRLLEEREQSLARQQAKMQAEIEAAYQQLERTCASRREVAAGNSIGAGDADLRGRKRELSSFAHYLREYRRRLQARAHELEQRDAQLTDSWSTLLQEQDQLLDEQRRLQMIRQEAGREQSEQVRGLLDGLARLYAESQNLRQASEEAAALTTLPVDVRLFDPTPNPMKRGRLTERVSVAALLERLGSSNS